MDYSPPWRFSSVHGDSPGKNTGVGCHALLRGVFRTQVSHIAGGFFTIWATSEAHDTYIQYKKKKSRDNAVIWFYLYVNSDCWYCLCLNTDKVSLSKHGGIMLGGRSFLLNRVKHVLLKIILKRKCLDFSCFKLVFSEFKALIWVTLKW